MFVEEVKPGFPNCVGRRFTGKGWKKVLLQFEFRSSQFREQFYDPNKCDLIVCWENDWPDCPLEVLELKEIIRDLPNRPIRRPGAVSEKGEYSFGKHYLKYGDKTKALFEKFDPQVRAINDEIFHKVTFTGVNYYSPERIFCYCDLLVNVLQITFFTRGKDLKGIDRFGWEKGGQKWGGFNIQKEDDIAVVVEILKESYKRIKAALKANENTGLYAEIREDEARNDQTGED